MIKMATSSLNLIDIEPVSTPTRTVCGKCKNLLSPKKENPIKCSRCGSLFHGKECCGVENATWDHWGPTKCSQWVCLNCKTGFHYDGTQGAGRPPKVLKTVDKQSKVPKPSSLKSNSKKVSDNANDKSDPSAKKTDSMVPVVVEPAASVTPATSQSSTTTKESQLSLESLDQLNPFKPRNSLAHDPISPAPVFISQENLNATQKILDEIDQDTHLATSTPVPKRFQFDDTNDNIEKAYTRLGIKLGLENLGPEDQTPGIRNLNLMVAYLIGTVMDLSGKLEGVSAKLEAAEAESKKLAAENERLRAANEKLQKRVDDADERAENYRRAGEYRQRMADNYSRVNNLVLHGAPQIVGEKPAQVEQDTFRALETYCGELGVSVASSDLDICHPLPSRGEKHKLIYRFIRRSKKNEVLAASKRVKVTAKKLNWDVSQRSVFVSDHISPDTARLLAEAKSRLSAKGNGPFLYVWAKMGRIYAGNGNRERPYEIRCQEDIGDLLQQFEEVDNGERHQPTPQNGGSQTHSDA